MRQATSMRSLEVPMLQPGIRVNTSPSDFAPFQQEQMVRFNGKVVLDFGSTTPSGHGAQSFYASAGLQLDPKMGWYKGLGRGEPFQVNGGESYPMEVLLGEWPGGDFKAWLLLEKDGVQYEKDTKGNPILPIFKLAAGDVTRSGGEAPAFAKQGPVWKAEKTRDVASASPTPRR
jgi:hypothetical protein